MLDEVQSIHSRDINGPETLAPDLVDVEPLIDRLLRVAGLLDGKFVIVGFGEDPGTDAPLAPEIVHVSNRQSDKRSALIAAIEHVSRRPGANAYIAPALFRPNLPAGKKGAEADVLCQLAIVSDFDQKQDPATRHQRLPICPHAQVETSPGNFQTWMFFDRPYPPDQVKPVLLALAAETKDDCKSVDHLFRVPGCLNWPTRRKREKLGRSPTPVRAKFALLAEPWDEEGVALDDLKATMAVKYWEPEVFLEAGGEPIDPSDGFDWHQSDKDEWNPFDAGEVIKHLSNPKYAEDRSKGAFRLMRLAKRRGYTPEKIVEVMLQHPTTPIMRHYADADGAVSEQRIRADVIRAYAKRNEAPRPSLSADHVFRWMPDEARKWPPRREIKLLGGELVKNVDDAEAAMVEQGTDIFQRGDMIVQLAHAAIPTRHDAKITGTRFVEVTQAALVEHMTAAAIFSKWNASANDWKPVNCPVDIAQTYLARRGRRKLRHSAGLINAPTLRPDGSVLDRPGYDEATGFYFDPGGITFLPIRLRPLRKYALAALAALKYLIRTFPFASPESRSVALSAILTAMVRRSLPSAPMHAFTAHAAGSGKGLLVDTVAMIATGRRVSAITQGRNEEETEKRLAAAFIAGDGVVLLDNCTLPIDGDTLCSIMTQESVKLRVLGHSELREVSTNATMFVNRRGVTAPIGTISP
jgi:hypothetical protein